jgi:hypothetical protein
MRPRGSMPWSIPFGAVGSVWCTPTSALRTCWYFLSHLVLKAFFHAPWHEAILQLTEQFWAAYRQMLTASLQNTRGIDAAVPTDLEPHAILNFAGCGWARLDGKSPVEYLTDPARREPARTFFRSVLEHPPEAWDDVLARCRTVLSAS